MTRNTPQEAAQRATMHPAQAEAVALRLLTAIMHRARVDAVQCPDTAAWVQGVEGLLQPSKR